jgi:hypothetical protein
MKALNVFIKKSPYLVWYTKNYSNLSEEAIIEAVLNYGSFDDFKKVVKILGIKKIAAIFKRGVNQKRCNYRPEIKNYFRLYFNKYA